MSIVPLAVGRWQDHLDLLRFLAAMTVVAGHARRTFFVGYELVADRNLLVTALYSWSGYAYPAVIVFFILSGFLIGGSVMSAVRQNRWSWHQFLYSRFARLYVVLIPGLLLTLVWDQFTCRLDTGRDGFCTELLMDLGWSISERSSPVNMIGNSLFLQEILVPAYGSNSPLWSLSYEFWYYIAFPALVVEIVAGRGRERFVWVIFLVSLGVFVGPRISGYFVLWLLGAGARILSETVRFRGMVQRLHLGTKSGFCVLLAALAIVRTGAIEQRFGLFASDAVTAVGATVFVLGASVVAGEGADRYSVLCRALAGFSYTLYLCHFPPLIFAKAWLTPYQKWQPEPIRVIQVCGLCAVLVAYCYGLSQLTERKTASLRAALSTFGARFLEL